MRRRMPSARALATSTETAPCLAIEFFRHVGEESLELVGIHNNSAEEMSAMRREQR